MKQLVPTCTFLTAHCHRLQELQGQGSGSTLGRLHLCCGPKWLWQERRGEHQRAGIHQQDFNCLLVPLQQPAFCCSTAADPTLGPHTALGCSAGTWDPTAVACCMQGEAIAFALGGNRKMLRAGSLAALLNQELSATGHRTAEVRRAGL